MTEKLPVGTLCWSLTAGFPLWPSVVMKESDVPETVLLEPHTSNQTLVRFFGSVSYGWMDVCYPFRDNFEQYSKPEGTWEGFEEAIQEAQEYERTGQFIVLTSGQDVPQQAAESSSEESDAPRSRRRKVAKRRRPAQSSDDDANFNDDSDGGRARGGRKTTGRRLKRGSSTTSGGRTVKTIRAGREQKLFAREIFEILKKIEKAVKESDMAEALALLKTFDPKAITKRVNKEGLTVDAPGPYALIETQVVHISRLGKFVHGLAKRHENDPLGDYARMLYNHLRWNAQRELSVPDDVEAFLTNQAHKTPDATPAASAFPAPTASAPAPATASSEAPSDAPSTSMDVSATETQPNQPQETTSQPALDSNGHEAPPAPAPEMNADDISPPAAVNDPVDSNPPPPMKLEETSPMMSVDS